MMRRLLRCPMASHPSTTTSARAWRSAWTAVLLIAAASAAAAALDPHVSLTSEAMLYLVAVVIAAYVCDRVVAVTSPVADAPTALIASLCRHPGSRVRHQ